MRSRHDSALVVVGGGAAGLMAALAAAEAGASMVVLERDGHVRSNTAISGGLIAAAGTRFQEALGIADSPEAMMADVMAKNGGRADAEVVRAVCERSADVADFLADRLGFEIHLYTDILHPGLGVQRLHATPRPGGSCKRACVSPPRRILGLAIAIVPASAA